MCGIAAIVRFDGQPVELPVLRDMARTLEHRGPDGEGHFVDTRVGLYHKRLAIIDLASGAQPMTRGDATIVFNGEIYNYVELREQLRGLGHEFRTTSDTEVILGMYAEHGERCVEQLNGMFAFVLYDRARGLVVAARDHFGIKPLYTWSDGRQLLFASEIKALLRHPSVHAEPNPCAIRDYVTFQFVLGDETLFRGVRKLLPGHYQVVHLAAGTERSTRYWKPDFHIDPSHTEEYFIAETRRLLADSVRMQLRSDVPVGTCLSGGLDSSIVTLLAARESPHALMSFTGAFDEGPEFDETAFAAEAARAAGAEMVTIVPTAHDFADTMERLVYFMDEPAAGPGLFPQYMVSRRAATCVKVLLGGQGGDEMFGGYARYMVAYVEQALKGAIFETNDEAEHIVSLESIVPNLPALRAYTPMMRDFWRSGLFQDMDRRYFRLMDRSGGALSLFSRDFRAAYDREEIFSRFQRVFNESDTRSYYNRMTHFDLVAGLPALLHVEDRASMSASIESRVPLLDRRLADLVTSMPPGMKFRGGELKYLLKRAMRGVVPSGIMERKDKMGFPVPLHLWTSGPAHELCADVLLGPAARARGVFDPVEIGKLLTHEGAFGRRLWGALNLELWFRQFIDAH